VTSTISSRPYLFQQLPPDPAPLPPALKQVVVKGIDKRCSSWRPCVLGLSTRRQPSLNRTRFHADYGSYAAWGEAALTQPQDFGERLPAGIATICPKHGKCLRPGWWPNRIFARQDCLICTIDRLTVLSEDIAECIAEVAQQMPAIGYLYGTGRSTPGAVGIHAGPVPCDDLNPGMPLQPTRHAAGVPVRQKIDHPITLQINDNRAVSRSAAPRPIIDANDTRRKRRINMSSSDQPQDRIATDWHRQFAGQSRTRFTPGCQSDGQLAFSQSHGAPCPRPHCFRHSFRKYNCLAFGFGTAKSSSSQPEFHDPTIPWQISQIPLIMTMNASGRLATTRTA
jgi:hypothetical protein